MSKQDVVDLISKIFPALGVGSLIVLAANQFIAYIKDKNKKIKDQDEEIQDLNNKIQQKNSEVNDAHRELSNFIDDRLDKLDSQGRAAQLLREYLSKIPNAVEEFYLSRSASRFIRDYKEELVNGSVNSARKVCKKYFPDKKSVELFRHDIRCYLDWLEASLYAGGRLSVISYLKNPRSLEEFPYRAAFKYLKDLDNFGQLNPAEIYHVKWYTKDLHDKFMLEN